jgi:ketol-acid reductoisomerase
VKTGKETAIVLKANAAKDYGKKLAAELKQMHDSEMWKAGSAVRGLRPENAKKKASKKAKKK